MIPQFDSDERTRIRSFIDDKLAVFSYGDLVDRLRPSTFGVTAATSIAGDEEVVGVDTTGGVVTVTLASSIAAAGREVVVTDVGGNAGTNAITVDTEGTETIDGGASTSIAANYGEVRLASDGSNWFTV